MMMTVDEKLHAYAKNQKDRNIDEKKLQRIPNSGKTL